MHCDDDDDVEKSFGCGKLEWGGIIGTGKMKEKMRFQKRKVEEEDCGGWCFKPLALEMILFVAAKDRRRWASSMRWTSWSFRLWCAWLCPARWAPWWPGSLSWASCAGFGTKFWFGAPSGTRREPSRSASFSSGSDSYGTLSPVPASGSGCTSDDRDAEVHWHLEIEAKHVFGSLVLNKNETTLDEGEDSQKERSRPWHSFPTTSGDKIRPQDRFGAVRYWGGKRKIEWVRLSGSSSSSSSCSIVNCLFLFPVLFFYELVKEKSDVKRPAGCRKKKKKKKKKSQVKLFGLLIACLSICVVLYPSRSLVPPPRLYNTLWTGSLFSS